MTVYNDCPYGSKTEYRRLKSGGVDTYGDGKQEVGEMNRLDEHVTAIETGDEPEGGR